MNKSLPKLLEISITHYIKHCIAFFILTLFGIQLHAQAPIIASISPASGPAGTIVTISGKNFNANAALNAVFFGAAKATLKSATNSAITAIVPAGATFQPVAVTTNNLTGYSARPFIVTYDNGGNVFTTHNAFAPKLNLPVDDNNYTGSVTTADINADGKPDLVVTTTGLGGGVRIYKNNGSSTKPFGPNADCFISNDIDPIKVIAADLDGDGLPDLSVANYRSPTFTTYLNTSSGGQISFAKGITFGKEPISAFGLQAGDFDLDGKLDIAVIDQVGDVVSVYKNTSKPGALSFDPKIDFVTGAAPFDVEIVDMDGDGRADIVTGNHEGATISVLRNTTSGSSISFDTKKDFLAGNSPYNIAVGDMNNDGKPDVGVVNHPFFGEMKTGCGLRNTSTPGNISFDTKVDFYTELYSDDLVMNDMDGDGRPDLAFLDHDSGTAKLLSNKSTGTALVFSGPISFDAGQYPLGIAVGDVNGDGKPDIVESNTYYVSLLINQSGLLTPGITSFTPQITGEGKTVTITGVNLTGTSAVYFGGVPATSFNVESATKVTAVVGTGRSGDITLTTPYGTVALNAFNFLPKPVIQSLSTSSSGGTYTVVINGSDFTGTTDVSIGGTPVTSFKINSRSMVTAVTSKAPTGNVVLTTPGGTATFAYIVPPTVTAFTPNTAPTGGVVNITGTNFTGATAVTFGTYKAQSFTVNSATSITATVNAAGSGNVAVTTSGGTGSLAGFTFISAPVVSYFTPNSAGAGATITITGNNFSGATAVSFGGVPAKSFLVNSATTITAVIGPSASGDVVVTTPGGTAKQTGFTFIAPPVITSADATGYAGSTVVINGSNLKSVTSVSFGGIRAKSFSILSDTKITAVPGSTGASGDITLTNDGNTVSFPGFTYLYPPTLTSISPTSGTVGTPITITGTNLTGTTDVRFMSSPATSFTVNSPTSITAVVGAGSSGTVYITTPAGTANINGFTFIQSQPAPTLASFVPAQGFIGSRVYLTGTNLTNVTSVTIGGVPAASFSSESATALFAYVGRGAVGGDIVVTTPIGSATIKGFVVVPPTAITGFSPKVAVAGTIVTITGHGFLNTTRLGFGSVPAKAFVVQGDDRITATVGDGAEGDIYLESPAGAGSITGFLFTPKPKVTAGGQTTFVSGGSVTLYATIGTDYAYQWMKNGKNISGATQQTFKATESGNYSVTLTHAGISLTSDEITVTVIYTLPASNFKVSATSATCKGENNGIIGITAIQSLFYQAVLTGNGLNKQYTFTNNLTIDNLTAGTYNVCITVDGQADYKQCYDLVITQPQDLSVFSSVNKATQTVNLSLNGSDNYAVELNGTVYHTTDNSISLPLRKGNNKLVVATDKLCQGIIEKTIALSDNALPYPNPFQDILNVNLGDTVVSNCTIRVFNIADGRLLYQQKFHNQTGVVQLSLAGLKNGTYSLNMQADNVESVFKIIKK
ncbi:IPT/TIG domain-containing protein [Mucilaginibacter kameinonensis]|uniref:IPT/TIG domain-containing protein n=1 Tax=Mucilaginibacter kameinonensis TaxID=452286 RepID=UPI000EF7BBB7|nr:IPT/TIG domain-containing protein [Mucilaginibacter kameinonensis]